MQDKLKELYRERDYLLKSGYDFLSDEVTDIEDRISEIEHLPSFEEVLGMISDGRMRSIFR